MKILLIRKQAFYFCCLGIICTLAFAISYDLDTSSSFQSICLLIISTGIIILCGLLKSIRMKEVFSLINVANIFSAFVFIARPVQILLSKSSIDDIYVIGMYNKINGALSFDDLPLLKASYIGFLGILSMNVFYFGIKRGMIKKPLNTIDNGRQINSMKKALSSKQILTILVVMCPAIFSMASFVIKQVVIKMPIAMIDVIWIYILCSLIAYLIAYQKRATIFVYFIIIISTIILGLASKRMYIVNLMLCFIVPLYYMGKNQKKDMKKIFLMIIALFVVVLMYGAIRANRIGANQKSIIESLMDEFCMYDMLVVSLKYYSINNIGLYYGYNFLTIFTTPIPGVSISQFDHELTRVVFNKLFNGGIPVTIFGSLYFNFSYLGIIFGSGVLGMIFRWIRHECITSLSMEKIIYYSIFTTFAYDIIRVGDIGREVWSCIIMLLVSKIFLWIVPIYRKTINKQI